jgi:hypothetical protein
MADERVAALLALMTLRAKFDDGQRHAPSLQDGVILLPDPEPLPRDAAANTLAERARASRTQFLHCTAGVIDGHLAIRSTPEGDATVVAQERAAYAQFIAMERATYGKRRDGAEVLVIDGVDLGERLEARWEDILEFLEHYRGDAYGGSVSHPSASDGVPPHIRAIWHTHQACSMFQVQAG